MNNKYFAMSIFLMSMLLSNAASAAPVAVGEPGETVVTGKASRYGGPSQFRPTFSIPSLKTAFAVGGYVKADFIYDFDYNQGSSSSPFTLGGKAETDGRFDAQYYESRLNLRSSSETALGDIDTIFEWDFWPSGDLRVRHAYGEWNNLLVGKTWVNAWSSIGSLRQVKMGAIPGGSVGNRQTQIRYTWLKGPNRFSASLEDPIDPAVAPGFAGSAPAMGQPLPTLTGRYEYKRNFFISGILQLLESVDGDESATAYGVVTGAQYALLPGTVLKGTAIWGEGVASYLGGGPSVGPVSMRDAYVDANGDLEPVEVMTTSVGIEHAWNDRWSSVLGFSQVEQDDIPNGGILVDDFKYGMLSLWWDPIPRLAIATELQYGEVLNQDGAERDATRLQTSFIFAF